MLSLTASSLKIRAAVDTDWSLLSDMYDDFELQDEDTRNLPPSGAKRRARWLDGLKAFINFVAVDGDRAAGHLVLQPTGMLAEITVFVHPDYRRQRVGESLLRAALAEAKRRSMESVWAVVSSENYGAQRLLHRVGFHKTWEKDGEQQLVFKC